MWKCQYFRLPYRIGKLIDYSPYSVDKPIAAFNSLVTPFKVFSGGDANSMNNLAVSAPYFQLSLQDLQHSPGI